LTGSANQLELDKLPELTMEITCSNFIKEPNDEYTKYQVVEARVGEKLIEKNPFFFLEAETQESYQIPMLKLGN